MSVKLENRSTETAAHARPMTRSRFTARQPVPGSRSSAASRPAARILGSPALDAGDEVALGSVEQDGDVAPGQTERSGELFRAQLLRYSRREEPTLDLRELTHAPKQGDMFLRKGQQRIDARGVDRDLLGALERLVKSRAVASATHVPRGVPYQHRHQPLRPLVIERELARLG